MPRPALTPLLLLPLLAAPARAAFETAAVRAAAARVEAVQVEDRARLDAYVERWTRECGWTRPSDRDCFLRPAPGRVLLFRGERDEYPAPMTAPMLNRWALDGENRLCGGRDCETHAELLAAVHRAYAGFAVGRWTPVYDVVARAWLMDPRDDTGDALVPLREAPLPHAGLANMVSTHVLGEPVEALLRGRRRDFDPMVSFTPDPRMAESFARPREAGRRGRVIVLSVPEADVVRPAGCRIDPAEAWRGRFVDVRACPRVAPHLDEAEYDAFLFVDAGLVSEAFLIPAR